MEAKTTNPKRKGTLCITVIAWIFVMALPMLTNAQKVLNRQQTREGLFVSRIIEYKPAPGQFINTSAWGTPRKAQSIIGGVKGGISLGAWGGYIVVGFSKAIENDADNPYGIDFTIYGNPLETWSEPGIVMVMKDKNKNGKPDDTWYEIQGSDHYWNNTQKNYELTYYNPNNPKAADVKWTDNHDNTGYVYANQFHGQPYYPIADTFPQIPQDKYTFKGTRIEAFVDKTIPTYIMSFRRGFGYADNFPRGSAPHDVPDNPYTAQQEGCGGDPIDIDWAVDKNGNPVALDKIDFVKIYCGVNEEAGWLGEVSTEVTAVMDVTPNAAITGEEYLLVIDDLPPQMHAGTSFPLQANFFHRGKRQPVTGISWEVSPAQKATITQENLLIVKDIGEVTVTASYNKEKLYKKSVSTMVIAPDSISIELSETEIREGDTLKLNASIFDQNKKTIPLLETTWEVASANLAIAITNEGTIAIAQKAGTCKLYAHPHGFPEIRDSVNITILEKPDTIDIYLTIQTDDYTLIRNKPVKLTNFNLNNYITAPTQDYGIVGLTDITAAHALASQFKNVAFESDMRFAENNDGLFIEKMPVQIENNFSYYYGEGHHPGSNWLLKSGKINTLSGFEKILPKPQDTLCFYYVEDTHTSWELLNIDLDKETIAPQTSVAITVTKEELSFTEKGISSSGIIPASNTQVTIMHKSSGETISEQTNAAGIANWTPQISGHYSIQTGATVLEVVVTGTTGIVSTPEWVQLYPNPANQELYIKLLQNNKWANIRIINTSGRVVYQKECAKKTELQVNTTTWPAGVYLITYTNQEANITHKILIVH